MQVPRKGAEQAKGIGTRTQTHRHARPGQRALVCVWIGLVSVWGGDFLVFVSPLGLRRPYLTGGSDKREVMGLEDLLSSWHRAGKKTLRSHTQCPPTLDAGQEAFECVCAHAWQGMKGAENTGAHHQVWSFWVESESWRPAARGSKRCFRWGGRFFSVEILYARDHAKG